MNIMRTEMYNGAVIAKIKKYDPLVSTDPFKPTEGILRNVFKISDNIAVHIKYAEGTNKADEYTFQYGDRNLKALQQIANADLFLVLVCADVKNICCISYDELLDLIERAGRWKNIIYVNFDGKNKFEVYVHSPQRGRVEKPIRVRVNDFPKRLFE